MELTNGKPRDILRRAHALIERGSEENWELIDAANATAVLDSFQLADDDDDLLGTTRPAAARSPFSDE